MNEKNKSISRIILALICATLFIFFDVERASASTIDGSVSSTEEIEIETVFINEENLTLEKLDEIHEENQALKPAKRAVTGTRVTAYVNRIGTGKICQIYLRWDGNLYITRWRLTELTIRSSNILTNTLYASFNPGAKDVPGATSGSVFIGTFSVPTSQSNVRVATKGLQAYTTSNGWLSAIVINGQVTIN